MATLLASASGDQILKSVSPGPTQALQWHLRLMLWLFIASVPSRLGTSNRSRRTLWCFLFAILFCLPHPSNYVSADHWNIAGRRPSDYQSKNSVIKLQQIANQPQWIAIRPRSLIQLGHIPYPPEDLNQPHQQIPYPSQDLKQPHQQIPYPPQDLNQPHQQIPYLPEDLDQTHQQIPYSPENLNKPRQQIPYPPEDLIQPHQQIPYPPQDLDQLHQQIPHSPEDLNQPHQQIVSFFQYLDQSDQQIPYPPEDLNQTYSQLNLLRTHQQIAHLPQYLVQPQRIAYPSPELTIEVERDAANLTQLRPHQLSIDDGNEHIHPQPNLVQLTIEVERDVANLTQLRPHPLSIDDGNEHIHPQPNLVQGAIDGLAKKMVKGLLCSVIIIYLVPNLAIFLTLIAGKSKWSEMEPISVGIDKLLKFLVLAGCVWANKDLIEFLENKCRQILMKMERLARAFRD